MASPLVRSIAWPSGLVYGSIPLRLLSWLVSAIVILLATGCADQASSPTEPGLATAAVSAPLRFRQINTGSTHTCGVTTGNQAYCWGLNNMGQLGIGSREGVGAPHLRPVAVIGGLSFLEVRGETTSADKWVTGQPQNAGCR